MTSNYKLMPISEIQPFIPLMEKERVSTRARKPDGFLGFYLSGGDIQSTPYPGKSHSYLRERSLFIKRVLPAYVSKPSLRRFLSLVAWGFYPTV